MSESAEQFEAQIIDYMEGKLSPAEAARVEMLLNNGDPKVAAMVRGMLEDRQHLRELQRPQAPGDLVERIMEHIERDSLLGTSIDHQLADERRRWFTSHMAIAAGLAIVIGGFLFLVITYSVTHGPDKGSREDQIEEMAKHNADTKNALAVAGKPPVGGSDATPLDHPVAFGRPTTVPSALAVAATDHRDGDSNLGLPAASDAVMPSAKMYDRMESLASASERMSHEKSEKHTYSVSNGGGEKLSVDKITIKPEHLGVSGTELYSVNELAKKNLLTLAVESNPVVVSFHPKDRKQYNELRDTVNLLIGEYNQRQLAALTLNGSSNGINNSNSGSTLNAPAAQQQQQKLQTQVDVQSALANNNSYSPVQMLEGDNENNSQRGDRSGAATATKSISLSIRSTQINSLLNRFPWQSITQKNLESLATKNNKEEMLRYKNDVVSTRGLGATSDGKLGDKKSSAGDGINSDPDPLVPSVIEIVLPEDMLNPPTSASPATAPANP